jgi:hypothetical protein
MPESDSENETPSQSSPKYKSKKTGHKSSVSLSNVSQSKTVLKAASFKKKKRLTYDENELIDVDQKGLQESSESAMDRISKRLPEIAQKTQQKSTS